MARKAHRWGIALTLVLVQMSCSGDRGQEAPLEAAIPRENGTTVRVFVAGSITTQIVSARVRGDSGQVGITLTVESSDEPQIAVVDIACADIALPSNLGGRAIVDDSEGGSEVDTSRRTAATYARMSNSRCPDIPAE